MSIESAHDRGIPQPIPQDPRAGAAGTHKYLSPSLTLSPRGRPGRAPPESARGERRMACEAEDMAGAAIFIPECPERGCAWVIWMDLDSFEPRVVAYTKTSPITDEECLPEPPKDVIDYVLANPNDEAFTVNGGVYRFYGGVTSDDAYYLIVLEDCEPEG